ncbi:MAG: hypothetical protein PHE56_00625 [Bacteroidales bacterium]|nr:hypothetical protein [Bacteroidales bacterium]
MAKLKAGTLVEVIVAIAIMVSVFTVAINIFYQINRNDNNYLKLKAMLIAREQLFVIKSKKEALNDNFESGLFNVNIESVEISDSLFKVTVIVNKENIQYFRCNEIISLNEGVYL